MQVAVLPLVETAKRLKNAKQIQKRPNLFFSKWNFERHFVRLKNRTRRSPSTATLDSLIYIDEAMCSVVRPEREWQIGVRKIVVAKVDNPETTGQPKYPDPSFSLSFTKSHDT